MKTRRRAVLLAIGPLLCFACTGETSLLGDAGTDGGFDAGTDGGLDAGTDGGSDAGASPFFADDFESYAVGAQLTGQGANGFSWGVPLYADVSADVARTGSKALKFYYGPTEPNGDPHWWSEQGFNFGRDVTELWLEYYLYFSDGSEGFGSGRYAHESTSTSNNNKFLALWAGCG